MSRKTTRIRTCFCLPPQTGGAEGRALEAVGGSARAAAHPACRAEAQRRRKPSAASCRVAAGRRREGRRNSFRAPNMFQPSRLPHTRQRLDCGVFSAALVRAFSVVSPFGLPSDFGFRPSDFALTTPLRPPACPPEPSGGGRPGKGVPLRISRICGASDFALYSALRTPRSALKESNLIQPNPTKKMKSHDRVFAIVADPPTCPTTVPGRGWCHWSRRGSPAGRAEAPRRREFSEDPCRVAASQLGEDAMGGGIHPPRRTRPSRPTLSPTHHRHGLRRQSAAATALSPAPKPPNHQRLVARKSGLFDFLLSGPQVSGFKSQVCFRRRFSEARRGYLYQSRFTLHASTLQHSTPQSQILNLPPCIFMRIGAGHGPMLILFP